MESKTIKIFVASSEELKEEREMLQKLANRLNTQYLKFGIHTIMIEWENLDAAMSTQHKQDDYIDELRECDICVVMFWRKMGMYTARELHDAYTEMKAGRKPNKIYVYFKQTEEMTPELMEFQASMPEKYEYFPVVFSSVEDLERRFHEEFNNYVIHNYLLSSDLQPSSGSGGSSTKRAPKRTSSVKSTSKTAKSAITTEIQKEPAKSNGKTAAVLAEKPTIKLSKITTSTDGHKKVIVTVSKLSIDGQYGVTFLPICECSDMKGCICIKTLEPIKIELTRSTPFTVKNLTFVFSPSEMLLEGHKHNSRTFTFKLVGPYRSAVKIVYRLPDLKKHLFYVAESVSKTILYQKNRLLKDKIAMGG